MSGDSKDEKATDAGGVEKGTDAGGVEKGTDAGGVEKASDAGGVEKATDAGGVEKAKDATESADVAESADTTNVDAAESADATEPGDAPSHGDQPAESGAVAPAERAVPWARVVAFAVLPALALLLALGAGFLKWQADTAGIAEDAADSAVQAATESTIALLSYAPDTVEQQLGAARDLLTGEFQQSYTDLTTDVVIPGAKEQQIAALASVPAAAAVSADTDHAVVLLFVNQTVTVGQQPPTDTASSVRVTLDKVDGRWLISAFDPV